MERFVQLVDYATPMDWRFPWSINLNEVFTLVGGIASSPYNDDTLYDVAYHRYNFNDQDPDEPFGLKFEELNPVIGFDQFQYTIYPDIYLTMPNGFDVDIDCLIPGLGVKYVLMDRTTRSYDFDDIVVINSRYHDRQDIRVSGSASLFKIYHITEIKFELRDSDYIACTPDGIKLLKDQFPETNILDIKFKCLNKTLPENYEDMPVPDPVYGCNDPNHYNALLVFRNRTIFNLLQRGGNI